MPTVTDVPHDIFLFERTLTTPEHDVEGQLYAILSGQQHDQFHTPRFLMPKAPHNRLYFEMYGFHPTDRVVQALLDLKKARIDCWFILDKSQAYGKAERALLEEFIPKMGGPDFFRIGTSQFHQIDHLKRMLMVWMDGQGKEHPDFLWDGSWNWSQTANRQDNVVVLKAGSSRYADLQHALDRFHGHWQWISEHEAAFQPGADGRLPDVAARAAHT